VGIKWGHRRGSCFSMETDCEYKTREGGALDGYVGLLENVVKSQGGSFCGNFSWGKEKEGEKKF